MTRIPQVLEEQADAERRAIGSGRCPATFDRCRCVLFAGHGEAHRLTWSDGDEGSCSHRTTGGQS